MTFFSSKSKSELRLSYDPESKISFRIHNTHELISRSVSEVLESRSLPHLKIGVTGYELNPDQYENIQIGKTTN